MRSIVVFVKVTLYLFVLAFLPSTSWSQVVIQGPTCVQPATLYLYEQTGLYEGLDTWNWSVTNGTIVRRSPPELTVKWNTAATTGQVIITSNKGTFRLNVTIISPFVTGSVATTLGGSLKSQTITANSVPATIYCTAASGGNCNTTYSYQWQKSTDAVNWQTISGATAQNLSFSAGIALTTYYRRFVTALPSNQQGYSDIFTVNVITPLAAGTISPSNQDIIQGSGVNVSIGGTLATGGNCASYSYQWQYSVGANPYADLPGYISANLNISGVNQTTKYRRRVICGSETSYSNEVTVTVIPQLIAGTVPSSKTITYSTDPGALTAASSTGGNCGTYSYQWQKIVYDSNFGDINGANALAYSPGVLTSTQTYRLRTVCGTQTVYSAEIKITVMPELQSGAISGPSSAITYNTSPGALSSATPASGGNCSGTYTYVWQSSSDNSTFTDLPNSNSPTYTPPQLTVTTYYKRKVFCGTETKSTNTITVTVMPQLHGGTISGPAAGITYNTSPGALSNTTLPSGGNCSGAYTYTWQWSTDNITFYDISETNVTSYTPSPLIVTTYYKRRVVCNTETKYSNVITVTVMPQLNPGTVGGSAAITYNTSPGTLISTASASGGNCSGGYQYQWLTSLDNVTFELVAGANSVTYLVGALTATRYYQRRVVCGTETKYSNVVTVTVMPQLQPGVINAGSTSITYNTSPGVITSTSPAAGGNCSSSYTYLWQWSTDNVTYYDIDNTNALTYTPQPLMTNTYFRRRVVCGSETRFSGAVFFTVMPQLQGGSITGPSSVITYNTSPGLFSNAVAASGGNCSNTYTYTWQWSTDNITYYDYNGTNVASYTPPALTAKTYIKRRVVCGTETRFSNVITINVAPQLNPGSITGPVAAITYNTSPGSITSSASASAGNCSGTYNYLWQSSTDNISFSDIQGSVGLTYTPGQLTSTTYFRRRVICGSEAKFTPSVLITVMPQLQPGSITGPTTAVTFNSAVNLANAAGAAGGNCSSNYNYIWQISSDNVSFQDIVGPTANSYTTEKLTTAKYFRRKVVCGIETRYTPSVLVTLMPQLQGGAIATISSMINYNTSPGQLTSIQAPIGGNCNGNVTYQWQKSTDNVNFENISGAVGLSYTPPALTQTTYYRRRALCSTEEATTNTIGIVVRPAGAPRCVNIKDTIPWKLDSQSAFVAYNITNKNAMQL